MSPTNVVSSLKELARQRAVEKVGKKDTKPTPNTMLVCIILGYVYIYVCIKQCQE